MYSRRLQKKDAAASAILGLKISGILRQSRTLRDLRIPNWTLRDPTIPNPTRRDPTRNPKVNMNIQKDQRRIELTETNSSAEKALASWFSLAAVSRYHACCQSTELHKKKSA